MSDIALKSAEQVSAEREIAAVHSKDGPFVVAADTTRVPMVITDANADGEPIIYANDAFLKLSGFARNEILGQRFDFMVHDPADPTGHAAIVEAFACNHDPDIRFRRKNGDGFWATVMVNAVRDDAGALTQHLASFVDQTARRREAAQARMLIDELNHRVKNMLSTVQSIITQGLRGATDPVAIRDSIESRLFALSRSHDLLTLDHWQGTGLADLVRSAMAPFGVGDGQAERFVIAGDNVRMPPRATLALGIAIHELATNAVKYGAFSTDAGTIRISWAIEPRPGDDRLVIRWEEAGGPSVTPPTGRGFGSRVIERGLAHELDGVADLDFLPAGVVCTIDLPVPKGAANA